MEKIENLSSPSHYGDNASNRYVEFTAKLNPKDETEIFKQFSEKIWHNALVLDNQGLLDEKHNSAEDMRFKIYGNGALKMNFDARINSHLIVVNANDVQKSLPSEMLQELKDTFLKALQENGYEKEAEKIQIKDMLEKETERTVLEIYRSASDKPYETQELLMKMEMDGNATFAPEKYPESPSNNFMENPETRKQLEDFVENMQRANKAEMNLVVVDRQMKGDETLAVTPHYAVSADLIAKEMAEVLKEDTTRTVMTISEIVLDDTGRFQYSEGKDSPDTEPPLLTVELDGYAEVENFFKNSETRDRLSDAAEIISDYNMNDTSMKYEIQHFKGETPLDEPVGSIFEGNDIAKTLDSIEPEKNANKNEYTK